MDLKSIYSVFEDDNKKRDLLEKLKPGCSLKFDSDGKSHIIKASINKIPIEKIELSKEVKFFEHNYFSEDKIKTALKSKGLTDLNIGFSKKILNLFESELSESLKKDSEHTNNSESKLIHCIHSIYISLISVSIDEKDIILKDTIKSRFQEVLKFEDEKKTKEKLLEIYDIFGMFVPLEFTLGGKYNVSFEVKDIKEKDNIIAHLNNLANLIFDSNNIKLDYKNNKIEELNNEIKKSKYFISLDGGDITQKYNFEGWIKSINIDNLEIIDFKTLVKIHDFCGDIKNKIDDIIDKEKFFINREGFNQIGYCFNNPDISIKIMISGDSYNGKTSIINRLKSGTFIQFYKVTVSLDFVPIYRKVKINNKEYLVKTTFVDTAGTEIYGNVGVGSSFIKQCDGFAINYIIYQI